MLLGIGYLPRRTGPALWRDFDPVEISDELAQIAALGFQAVRVPLFWADFQPRQDEVSLKALEHLAQFLQIASEQQLRVHAGLWAGMWDGALWWPAWGLTPAPLPLNWPMIVNNRRARLGRLRSPFADERVLESRMLLATELAANFGDHPALLGWEPLPGFGRLAASADKTMALEWLAASCEMLANASPNLPCSCLLAADALEAKTAIRPQDILAAGAQPSLSVATFASDRRRLPLSVRWVIFTLDLMSALAGQSVSLCLAGLPTAPIGEESAARDGIYYASEEDAAAYLRAVIAIARQRQCPQVWLWRWADIPEDQWDRPPYEIGGWRRVTGLLRADGQAKMWTNALTGDDVIDYPKLDFDIEAYLADPQMQFEKYWRQYQWQDDPRQFVSGADA
ncbi:MAG: beta-galactosidase [Caldilineales bacterium]|nr:beta-galactosidase [Caldilineales bacterium]